MNDLNINDNNNLTLLIKLIKNNRRNILITTILFAITGSLLLGLFNGNFYENNTKLFYTFNDNIYRSDMIDYEDKNMNNVLEYLKINIEEYNEKEESLKLEKNTSNIIVVTLKDNNKNKIEKIKSEILKVATSDEIKNILSIKEIIIIGEKDVFVKRTAVSAIMGLLLGVITGFLYSILRIILKEIMYEK